MQGDVVGPAMLRLRTFMFERVYLGPIARDRAREDRARAARAVRRGSASTPTSSAGDGALESERVIDYLAGMTDRFAIRAWEERFVPRGFAA